MENTKVNSPEYDEILSSLQKVVRQAYALGRSEALKQVVEVMKTDETSWKPLQITGPIEPREAAVHRVRPLREAVVTTGGGESGRTDTGRTPVHAENMDPAVPTAEPDDSLPWWNRPAPSSRPVKPRPASSPR